MWPWRPADRSRGPALGAAGLTLAALAAYHNSFAGPFVFDDIPAVLANPAIRRLWPIGPVLAPPADGGLTIAGRPLVNLSLALNYAISGPAVGSYHAVNLAIHLLATLALFGLVRRTPGGGGPAAGPAFVIALLWSVHPLQTESVTYVMQRAESLMGLLYLLTLYCFVRHTERGPAGGGIWAGLSLLCCLLGMATKEVMVSAPLMVFLYDRTFVAGSFAAAWRTRWRLYLGLAATWLLLAYLVLGSDHRGGTAGFASGLPWWRYAATQAQAIGLYLRLAVWPHPLVFDYGTGAADRLGAAGPALLLIAGLLAGTGLALWRWPRAGFLGAWFFLILAPSSSVLPIATQTMAEHRMYLPLAAIVVAVVLGLRAGLGGRGLVLGVAAAAALGVATIRRNADYRSAQALWGDTALKCPDNPRALYNLGNAWRDLGRPAEAVAPYEAAVRLRPDFAEAQNNLASVLAQADRPREAVAHFQRSIALNPDLAPSRYNFANVLAGLGRRDEAIAQYEAALRIDPGLAEAQINLGHVLLELHRWAEAAVHYEAAARLRPGDPDARHNADLLREFVRAHPAAN
jgi:tetratricopeptide (TPR) repeat protein